MIDKPAPIDRDLGSFLHESHLHDKVSIYACKLLCFFYTFLNIHYTVLHANEDCNLTNHKSCTWSEKEEFHSSLGKNVCRIILNSPTIVLLTKLKSGVTQMRTCLTLLKQWSSDKDTAVSLEWNECQVYSTAKLFDGSV